MSEYQYYEFRTDGRTLDRAARKKLEQLSSRAIVTTQAIYTYSYSDFKYDSKEILADYFDFDFDGTIADSFSLACSILMSHAEYLGCKQLSTPELLTLKDMHAREVLNYLEVPFW